MARRLPEEPVKRRQQVFKRIYQNLEHWQALMEDRGMEPIITDEVTGEDIYIGDLLVGLDALPPRQREAFELICLQGYTETAARDLMLPNSKSSTPVQQYADSGLIRVIDAYDLYQRGQWPPPAKPKPKKKTLRRRIMAVLHPLVREGLEIARKKIVEEIAGLQQALAQVDQMLGQTATTPAPPPPPPAAQTPPPGAKPKLNEMAREATEQALASTG